MKIKDGAADAQPEQGRRLVPEVLRMTVVDGVDDCVDDC